MGTRSKIPQLRMIQLNSLAQSTQLGGETTTIFNVRILMAVMAPMTITITVMMPMTITITVTRLLMMRMSPTRRSKLYNRPWKRHASNRLLTTSLTLMSFQLSTLHPSRLHPILPIHFLRALESMSFGEIRTYGIQALSPLQTCGEERRVKAGTRVAT